MEDKVIPRIEFITEDRNEIEIVMQYWAFDIEKEVFTFTQKEIQKKFNMTPHQLESFIAPRCKVWSDDVKCQCGHINRYYQRRRDFNNRYSSEPQYCNECKERQRSEQHMLSESKMKIAFKERKHLALNKIEYITFKLLAQTFNQDKVRLQMGFSPINMEGIMVKLHSLHLIRYSSPFHFILPEYESLLNKDNTGPVVRTIFGSEKNRELYKYLCLHHPFVYPEIPLCAFIEFEAVKEFITQDWQEHYFKNCRFDAVICDYEGLPQFVCEYQSGYHSDKFQMGRDTFKKRITEALGIPVHYYTFKDLQKCV